jgi:dihydropteroate synthase
MDQKPGIALQCGPFRLNLAERTLIMGILNVTPDSFSDGGRFFDREDAIAHGQALAGAGADIIDVGGESTRPFSDSVPAEEEMRRVIPVVEALAGRLTIPISIDTQKADVARHALSAGATMVNDIRALRLDTAMASVVAAAGVPVILMHMKGTPKDMQVHPHYDDVVEEVKGFLSGAVEDAQRAGVGRANIIVDPGIGFGKTVMDNLLLIKHLSSFHALGLPVLIGPSRKSFIGKILGDGNEAREVGTQAVVAAAALQGVQIVRVHDVARTKQTLQLVEAIKAAH